MNIGASAATILERFMASPTAAAMKRELAADEERERADLVAKVADLQGALEKHAPVWLAGEEKAREVLKRAHEAVDAAGRKLNQVAAERRTNTNRIESEIEGHRRRLRELAPNEIIDGFLAELSELRGDRLGRVIEARCAPFVVPSTSGFGWPTAYVPPEKHREITDSLMQSIAAARREAEALRLTAFSEAEIGERLEALKRTVLVG